MTSRDQPDDEADNTFVHIMVKAKEFGKDIEKLGLGDIHPAYTVKQAKIDFEAECEYERENETEVERLCNKIKGIKPVYEMTFKEYWELHKARMNKRIKSTHREITGSIILHKQPKSMTNKQWTEAKRKFRRQQKEDNTKWSLLAETFNGSGSYDGFPCTDAPSGMVSGR